MNTEGAGKEVPSNPHNTKTLDIEEREGEWTKRNYKGYFSLINHLLHCCTQRRNIDLMDHCSDAAVRDLSHVPAIRLWGKGCR